MCILLQNGQTESFLVKPGVWSDDPDQARRFQGAHEAIAMAHDLGLFEARVYYHFRDDQDDFTLPVRAGRV